MTPESPAWLRLIADQERIASHWDAQIQELQKLCGDLDPARMPPPEAPPEPLPIWCTLLEIPKDASARLKRKLRRQHAAAAKKAVKEMPPAPQLPANAVEGMYRKMRRAAVFYVPRRLIELCPLKGTLIRAQARGVLHQLCFRIRSDALGGALRDQAHAAARDPGAERLMLSLADGDLERAARADLGHLYRNDRWIGWWLLRELAAQKKALLDRVEGNQLWFPVILASPAVEPESIFADTIMDTATRSAPEPVAPVEPDVAGEPPVAEPFPARKKRGPPWKQETEWSESLAKRIADLSALLAPEKATSQEELGKILHINPRDLRGLDKLGSTNERRCRVEKELMSPDLVNEIRSYRAGLPKSAPASLSSSPDSPNSHPNSSPNS
jgi:hypothetical protein